MTYAPFCFFNLVNPLIAAAYGWTNTTIVTLPPVTDYDPPKTTH